MSPYYLREDFRPDIALRPLLEESDAPESLLLVRNTAFVEMQQAFMMLAGRHRLCQLLFLPDGRSFQIDCLPPPRAGFRATRLVITAPGEEQALRLRDAFAGIDTAVAGVRLTRLAGPDVYHRLWVAELP